jgi:aspartate/glutamate racemase
VNSQLGDLHSAKLLLYSIDFDEFKTLADAGDWPNLTEWLNKVINQTQLRFNKSLITPKKCQIASDKKT